MDSKTKVVGSKREEKRKESRVRRLAKRCGFHLEKLRGPISNDNCGLYRLIDGRGIPYLGFHWDADLDEIEAFIEGD